MKSTLLAHQRFAIAALLSIAAALVAVPANAVDHSLRIGTVNAWMKPAHGPIITIESPGVCFSGCKMIAHVPPHTVCECGSHEAHFTTSQLVNGANNLAERIRNSGYDVMVVNEVFDDDARNTLAVAMLNNGYINAVTYVDNDDNDLQTTASGLMFFAKPHLEFVDINDNMTGGDCVFYGVDVGGPEVSMYVNGVHEPAGYKDKIGVDVYNDCAEGDCYANKSLVYVRLQDQTTGRLHNIFYTHMNGSYNASADESFSSFPGASARHFQLWMFKRMFDCATGPGNNQLAAAREDIFFLGDMNIDGDLSNSKDDWDKSAWNNKAEWTEYFNSNNFQNGLLTSQLHDIYFNTGVIGDTFPTLKLEKAETPGFPGIPNPTENDWAMTAQNDNCPSSPDLGDLARGSSADGCRIDHILHNNPLLETKFCNQHTTVSYNLHHQFLKPNHRGVGPGGRNNSGDGKSGLFSAKIHTPDHTGVSADYNLLAPQCSPLLSSHAQSVYGSAQYGAETLDASDTGSDASDGTPDFSNKGWMQAGIITNPGNVQWWRIELPGSYLIGMESGDPTKSFESGFRPEIYRFNDLSSPLPGYKDEVFTTSINKKGERGVVTQQPITGFKYDLNNPPYYVKVSNLDHDTTGTYFMGVHRLNCTNKFEESCIFNPNIKYKNFKFPNFAINSSPATDSLYFNFNVEPLTVPNTQKLRFIASDYPQDVLEAAVVGMESASDIVQSGDNGDPKKNSGGADRMAFEGFSVNSSDPFDPAVPCPNGNGALKSPNYKRCNNVITWLAHPQPQASSGTEHTYRVRRLPGNSATAIPFAVTWWTNLTTFYGSDFAATGGPTQQISLTCHTETTDVSPSDEIGLDFFVDGGDFPSFFLGDFNIDDDESVKYPVADIKGSVGYPIRFVNQIKVTIYEWDDTTEDESGSAIIYPKSWDAIGNGSAASSSSINFSIDDGAYELRYNYNHGLQTYAPPDP